ncbi:MAG: helix-turn-helix transcriptional regulator [Bacteroidota bacterium]
MLPKVLVAASATPLMLSILAQGEAYGYQIIQRIHDLSEGRLQWSAGTLYPVLHRMETKGLIASTWRTSDVGRDRKYYTLTPKGQEALQVEQRQWMDVHRVLVKLWGPEFNLGLAS